MIADSQERLDSYLARTRLAPSRRVAQKLISEGAVLVNGRRVRKAQIVGVTDRVQVLRAPDAVTLEPNPNLNIDILFSDTSLIVANKPGGMPCHPLRAGERETVMNAIVAIFPETASVGGNPREGGLVHRLDNGTSGALLIARTSDAFQLLRDAIRSGKVRRTYEALVTGDPRSTLELAAPIAHHPANPRKMVPGKTTSTRPKRVGRQALTIVEPIRRIRPSTLVRVIPRSGSRHQIRVHLANAGFPIVGDTLYGGSRMPSLAEGRFWLHLKEMELDSPTSGRIKVTAPIPDDLKALIR